MQRWHGKGEEPKRRKIRGPVGWLLGPELVGRLRQVFRRRANPRQWMPYHNHHLHDERAGGEGALRDRRAPPEPQDESRPTVPERRIISSAERVFARSDEPVEESLPVRENDVWFDYAADMGDAADGMYGVAYGLMVSFALPELSTGPTATWEKRNRIPLSIVDRLDGLPRGQFVFIGGDTAYHVSDAVTLRARVEEPFVWAWQDARARGHLCAADANPLEQYVDPDDGKTRRLYGIPGNHDWYDNLDGFSIMFRVGAPAATVVPVRGQVLEPTMDKTLEALDLPHLKRMQLASFVGIELAHGWQLWGLDLDSPLDRRQQEYFLSLHQTNPENLIVVTPSPAIVFGARHPHEDNHEAAAKELEVPVPPLAELKQPDGPRLRGARLEISGDVHHYARYFPTKAVPHYGSVVAGLGGVFHHPSFTKARGPTAGIPPVTLYPEEAQSRAAVSRGLLTWTSTWFGSWGRIIPLVLAMLCGFAATRSHGAAWLLAELSSRVGLPSHAPAHGREALVIALVALLGIASTIGLLVLALKLGIWIFGHHEKHAGAAQNIVDVWSSDLPLLQRLVKLADPSRSYWAAWALGTLAFAPLIGAPLLAESSFEVKTTSLGLDVAFLVVLALPIVGGLAGWAVAGKHLARDWRKYVLALVGFVHALLHVATALVFSQISVASWPAAAATVGVLVGVAALLYVARFLFCSASIASALALAMVALCVATGSMVAIVAASNGVVVTPATDDLWLVRYVLGALFAMPLGTMWFVWYLAVAARLDGHNNEAGGAARVTKFRQFIRFRVHAGGLTGYVISVENKADTEYAPTPSIRERVRRMFDKSARPIPAAAREDEHLEFSLIDVFTVARRESS